MGKVVTREWRKAKSAKLEFAVVSAFRDNSSFGLNILGPLCLWQCFIDNTLRVKTLIRLLDTYFYIFISGAKPNGLSIKHSKNWK